MADDIKEQKMEYTFATTFFLNIPLATVEYLICILLAGALLDQKADRKKAVLLWIPYILLLIIPASLFFVLDLYGNFGVWMAETYLEAACFGLVLKGFYQTGWINGFVTSAAVVFLYGIFQDLEGLFLTGNYDLSVPKDLAIYMAAESVVLLLPAFFAAWFIRRNDLCEEYNNFLSTNTKMRYWKLMFLMLPAVKSLTIELANERLVLNNSNPVISLLFLLLLYGVVNHTFRCEMQKRKIEEQNLNLSQQEFYIQTLEHVQKDVRIFRHDFKNMMAGAIVQADEGNLRAVQEFISELTGDFEGRIGKKIFQISQLGNIHIPELKGLLAMKIAQMQEREIPVRLEAEQPVTDVGIPVRDLCRAVGILLDNAMEETEVFQKNKKGQGKISPEVAVLFYESQESVSILVKNPVREAVPLPLLGKEGYSTKGEGHGTGLASLRRIVESYDMMWWRTSQAEGWFEQELVIGRWKGERNGSNISL